MNATTNMTEIVLNYETLAQQAAMLASGPYSQGQSYLGETGMNVLILAFGIAFYTALVGTFYNKLSKKVLYDVNFYDKYGKQKSTLKKFLNLLSFVINYAVVFPLITFSWFILLSAFLYLLSRTLSVETVLLIALSVVAAIRICAYYREEIAVDLAKTLPLALLGVVLVEPTAFTSNLVNTRLAELLVSVASVVPFLGLIVGLEWTLRILLAIKRVFVPKKNNNSVQ
ncbi:hypothetical protein HY571_01365 [Candidatus Micrarchaeota archaeon]|nr:hypothetical protein [Candidatus Micrarchaeota archaeon]